MRAIVGERRPSARSWRHPPRKLLAATGMGSGAGGICTGC